MRTLLIFNCHKKFVCFNFRLRDFARTSLSLGPNTKFVILKMADVLYYNMTTVCFISSRETERLFNLRKYNKFIKICVNELPQKQDFLIKNTQRFYQTVLIFTKHRGFPGRLYCYTYS